MDIISIFEVLRRRWLVVLPIILITAFVAFRVGTGTEPEYQAAGSVLLTAGDPRGALVASSGVLPVGSSVLAAAVESPQTRERLRSQGATAPFEVNADPVSSIITITATGSNVGENEATVASVLAGLDTELEELEKESGAPTGTGAKVQILAEPAAVPGAGAAVSGSAFLVPEQTAAANPLPPTGYTTRILQELMVSPEAAELVYRGARSPFGFVVEPIPRDIAPILAVAVRGTDREAVAAGYDAVLEAMQALLDKRQPTASEGARTVVTPLSEPAGAFRTSGDLVKSVVTVVGLGLIAAASLAVLLEAAAVARRRRREPEPRHVALGEADPLEPRQAPA